MKNNIRKQIRKVYQTGILDSHIEGVDMIYFDMDGVLADFSKGLQDICGIEPVDQATATDEQDDAMWAAVRDAGNFYERLAPIEKTLAMFKALYAEYGSSCQILTAAPKKHRGITTAEADKRTWVKKYLPEGVIVNVVFAAEDKREFCKGPGCVLIDDYDSNIREWENMDGTGVLFTEI